MAEPSMKAALFKNERRERDNQPDFTGPGSITPEDLKSFYDAAVNGTANFDADGRIKIRVAAWRKDSSAGRPYLSLSISIDNYRADVPAGTTTGTETQNDDFIPF